MLQDDFYGKSTNDEPAFFKTFKDSEKIPLEINEETAQVKADLKAQRRLTTFQVFFEGSETYSAICLLEFFHILSNVNSSKTDCYF